MSPEPLHRAADCCGLWRLASDCEVWDGPGASLRFPVRTDIAFAPGALPGERFPVRFAQPDATPEGVL